jgi:ethanolamine transporter EutH
VKTAYAVMAVTLAANDVSPWWLAWMIAGAVLLAAVVVVLVVTIRTMLRRHEPRLLWVFVMAGLVVAWLTVGWPQGWV